MNASTKEEVEALRIKYLSKKGEISALFNDFRNVPNEQKKGIGQKLNQLKVLATDKINALRENVETSDDADAAIDLTRPAAVSPLGTRHPISLIRNEIISIFSRLGFTVADGPEVEDDWHVFSALNFAADHPARDMQDTFFIQRSPDVLLRTHTSSVQTRVMTSQQPPIRIICPGRVYRNEAISARAHCFFHQIEALYIDKNVSFADLKQTLLYFARELFGSETKSVCVRLISHSPNHRLKWTSPVIFVAERVADSASIPVGLKSSVAVWWIQTYSNRAASTARCTPVSLSVWAWSA